MSPSVGLMPAGFSIVFALVLVLVGTSGCGGARRKNASYHHQNNMRIRPIVSDKEADLGAKEKICIGTNGRMSVPSNREHHYRNLKDRFTNCTYVDGNLELTWLQDANLDLSFLQYIREVTGYVLISHVDINIVLPRLQIIRGRTLFKMSFNEDEFALAITLNKMYHLELPALRDILTGSVGIINNYNLCHIKTIDWNEIISDPKAKSMYVYNFTSDERECSACHKDCPRGCWGPGVENCQQFSKQTCSPQCDQGRCFGPNPRECCHLFCAGGCTGPRQNDCIACRNFYDDGVCTMDCPPMQIYNPTTYSWEVNPNGKYAYGATCVKKCPEHLLKDSGACVRTCPLNKKAVDGECVLCDGACPKSCRGDTTVHSGNIDKFQGCTVIEGSLSILENTFKGYQHVYPNYTFGERYTPIHPDRLEVFSTLKEVTGYLNIQAYHPGFKNLSYFRNLEVIRGRALYEMSSLYIVKTSLESLELKSLKKIDMGSVAILENKHLCFAGGVNWNKIIKKPSFVVSNNSDMKTCKEKGFVCDEQCSKDGCWGSGPTQCLSCAHYKLGDKCLKDCSSEPGIYRAENNECRPCHEQCGDSCHGPGANNCTSCRNFKDGPFCVESCPSNKYVERGICKPCHSTCVDGCTGPRNTVGPNGCMSCELAIMNENATVDVCLHKNDSCPDGYYVEYVGPQIQEESFLRLLSGKAICRKCHPRCKKCSGYGFHELICQECTNFKKGEQCEDECAMDHYPDFATHICMACDAECRGCTGPGPENCITCQNYKLYDDGWLDPNNTFTCVSTCPPEFPHRVYPDKSDSYCSDKPEPTYDGLISSRSPTYVVILIVCTVIGIFFITLIIGVLFYCQRKQKMKENEINKMTMALTGLEDNEPLRPSNVLPNVAQLKIIKETEIRKGSILGYGAFGTVYKGVWAMDGEHSAKIPVAIKVLRSDTGANTSKEFLSEAYIMASIDHPNLLKLLAVCMTSEMMLITQLMPLGCLLDFVRKNHERIGSKTLLNWCTQIARGMAYLEEKRLVHRDLAARNVLVQKPSCVKITDFGLAKLLDLNEEEYKAAGGKMPIKWLALECIQHRIFTHKSDVWAFGVTVWELLTFGGRPYENVPARDVPELLEKGERLPQPQIASIDVYMIMIKCWMLDAESRPCFKELEDDFSKMATDPGRYLAIPGDRFMRLQNYATLQSERDMMRSLASDSIEISEIEEHMQPKSRAPLHGTGLTSASPAPDRYWPSSLQMTSDGSVSMYPHSQNHFNQRLLRYTQGRRSFEPSTASEFSSVRYCEDSIKAKTDTGSDEYDSSVKSQAQVGTLKLELPVDEEDYLMPSPQCNQPTSTYLDVIDVKNSTEFFKSNIDNPEYLLNNDVPCQTVGLPSCPEYENSVPESSGRRVQRSSEEESDHECYNDFDRLRRELQPLQKGADEALV